MGSSGFDKYIYISLIYELLILKKVMIKIKEKDIIYNVSAKRTLKSKLCIIN